MIHHNIPPPRYDDSPHPWHLLGISLASPWHILGVSLACPYLSHLHPPQGQEWRHACGGLVVVAANAGGAWSPIGDVTTTMLWIQHKARHGWLD
eukprot:Skav218957  [mRNA]  locus=scaffold3699:124013:124294:+ [translate_table: standard]